VFHYLKNVILKECFTYENWTSGLRDRAGFEAFEGNEDRCADFTFQDVKARMTEWLVKKGVEEARTWVSKPPVYHVEVKSTTGLIGEIIHLSEPQAQLVCVFFTRIPFSVSILVI